MKLLCLSCIYEHKTQDTPTEDIREAVTIAATELGLVTPLCMDHIGFQKQSQLLAPPHGMPQIQL